MAFYVFPYSFLFLKDSEKDGWIKFNCQWENAIQS